MARYVTTVHQTVNALQPHRKLQYLWTRISMNNYVFRSWTIRKVPLCSVVTLLYIKFHYEYSGLPLPSLWLSSNFAMWLHTVLQIHYVWIYSVLNKTVYCSHTDIHNDYAHSVFILYAIITFPIILCGNTDTFLLWLYLSTTVLWAHIEFYWQNVKKLATHIKSYYEHSVFPLLSLWMSSKLYHVVTLWLNL